MELEEIKELLDAFEERNMQKFQLKQGEFELILERTPYTSEIIQASPMMSQVNGSKVFSHQLPAHLPSQDNLIENKEGAGNLSSDARCVTSPMVGTFYASPSPDEPPFVKAGDQIEKGQVVCIIEAMKVMNEVKSTESGTIQEILVESGHPVEFGTKILRIS